MDWSTFAFYFTALLAGIIVGWILVKFFEKKKIEDKEGENGNNTNN
jgi:hypothetical protein